MTDSLPHCPTLLLDLRSGVLTITINRPDTRNALSDDVVRDLHAVAIDLGGRGDIRVALLRGSAGTFCAGGDVRGFRGLDATTAAGGDGSDPFVASNRDFGDCLLRWNALPQVTVALVEGAAFGGGLGLACIADIVLATRSTRFAVSETRLGVVPAQIAPLLVRRVGLAAARRAALTGQAFEGDEAKAIGLVNEVFEDSTALEAGCEALLSNILQCAPRALATTKSLLLRVDSEPMGALMQDAAVAFADAVQGAEGREGISAFLEKRRPAWNVRASNGG